MNRSAGIVLALGLVGAIAPLSEPGTIAGLLSVGVLGLFTRFKRKR